VRAEGQSCQPTSSRQAERRLNLFILLVFVFISFFLFFLFLSFYFFYFTFLSPLVCLSRLSARPKKELHLPPACQCLSSRSLLVSSTNHMTALRNSVVRLASAQFWRSIFTPRPIHHARELRAFCTLSRAPFGKHNLEQQAHVSPTLKLSTGN